MESLERLSGAAGAASNAPLAMWAAVIAQRNMPSEGPSAASGGDARGADTRREGQGRDRLARQSGAEPSRDQIPPQASPETKAEDSAEGLTPEEQAVVAELKARDREVRDHEQAHARVGGPYAGEPSYSYQTGPDGRRYAIGGQVPIDVSPIPEDPEATISKMTVVKAAALAPAEPSAADRQVAALAEAQKLSAMADLAALRQAQRTGGSPAPYSLPQTDPDPTMDRRI